ncbi:MAG: hypothetical protein JWO52_616 [Gammaproteobacteria bacterium]|nr:hypothetical protein [Gammaproteobacteria bacterium]
MAGGALKVSHQAGGSGGLRIRLPRVHLESLEPVFVDSIDQRMQFFVEWRGEVPLTAKRLEDFDARQHAATWIRHNIGRGVAGAYVTGYAVDARWWSYFFERIETCAPEGAEVWSIEAYNHEGKSWLGRFYYWPDSCRWRDVPLPDADKNGGRHETA